MIDSDFKIGSSYYLRVSLEECKYIVKEGKMIRYINDDLEIKKKKIPIKKIKKRLVEYRKSDPKMWRNRTALQITNDCFLAKQAFFQISI